MGAIKPSPRSMTLASNYAEFAVFPLEDKDSNTILYLTAYFHVRDFSGVRTVKAVHTGIWDVPAVGPLTVQDFWTLVSERKIAPKSDFTSGLVEDKWSKVAGYIGGYMQNTTSLCAFPRLPEWSYYSLRDLSEMIVGAQECTHSYFHLGEQLGFGGAWDGNGFFILDNPALSLLELCSGSVQFWTMPLRHSVVDYSEVYDGLTSSFDWKMTQTWDKLRIYSDTYTNYRVAGSALYLSSANSAQCPWQFLKLSAENQARASVYHAYFMRDTWVG